MTTEWTTKQIVTHGTNEVTVVSDERIVVKNIRFPSLEVNLTYCVKFAPGPVRPDPEPDTVPISSKTESGEAGNFQFYYLPH